MSRHLISLIDGTMVSANQASPFQGYSNVFELAYMLKLKSKSDDGRPQIVFYTSGISSQPDTKDLLSSATGRTIRAQILDQYTNICSNYDFSLHDDPMLRDKIYLFGFSRGAMAARAIAGLIMEYGLLEPQYIRFAPKIVSDWENNEPRPNYVELVEVDVEFIGVFDSVMGGIRRMKMFNPIQFPHHRLSGRCKYGIHIQAIDEDRALFRNQPWERHDEGNSAEGMKQIWMPGVHSDVGGTANEFWGRASFLAMSYYIEKLTDLQLDDSWLRRKERAFRADLRSKGAYKLVQHLPPKILRARREPSKTAEANEVMHPVVDIIRPKFTCNGREEFPWKERTLDPFFGDIDVDKNLSEYFDSFLKQQ